MSINWAGGRAEKELGQRVRAASKMGNNWNDPSNDYVDYERQRRTKSRIYFFLHGSLYIYICRGLNVQDWFNSSSSIENTIELLALRTYIIFIANVHWTLLFFFSIILCCSFSFHCFASFFCICICVCVEGREGGMYFLSYFVYISEAIK